LNGPELRPEDSAIASIAQEFIATQSLPADYAEDVRCCYGPLAEWLAGRCRPGELRIAAINGAQGTGKSTLARFLGMAIERTTGLAVAVLSLDDFYLPRGARRKLAESVHPLLATRGVPGTHDIALLVETIERLASLVDGEYLRLPAFDKAADDRVAADSDMRINGPVDLVLFEGWCVGTPAQMPAELRRPVNALEQERDADGLWRRYVNDRLGAEYRAVFRRIHDLVFLRVPDFDAAFRWRLRQERRLAAARQGPGVMTAREVRAFMAHYERLTRHALDCLPGLADAVIELDSEHRCRALRFRRAAAGGQGR